MRLKDSTRTFERIAFEFALRLHPGDTTAKAAFTDWLIENGYTPIGARREATRVVREEVEKRQCQRVANWINAGRHNHSRVMWLLMKHFKATFYAEPQIIILPGGGQPEREQEGGDYEDDRGVQWMADPTYELDPEHTHYIPTAYIVRVGAGWIVSKVGDI
jgi:uncharacterized protein (TIGR02996 family)